MATVSAPSTTGGPADAADTPRHRRTAPCNRIFCADPTVSNNPQLIVELGAPQKRLLEIGSDGVASVSSMLDRMLHHGHVLKCGPRSWRTKAITTAPEKES